MQFRYSIMGAALIVAGCVTPAAAEPNTKFLTEAIQINLAEISVGQLAQEKGGSDDVKSFGKMLVDDHTASNSKATALAQSNGMTPPTEPKPDDKNKHDELAKLSGGQFDREFAKAMTEGHEEAISKFEAASKGDDDIAKFAQETLPTLQKHLKTAQSLGSNKSAQTESPMAPEAAKPESQMTPSAPANSEAAPAKETSEAEGARKMVAPPSDAMGVNDYYKQNVYDRSDNSIGEVSDLLLDKSGQVRAVMLSVGGFLGVGGKYVSVPFDALEVREKNGNRYLVMDTTKEALKSAPGYQYDRTAGKWVPEKG